MDYDAEYDLGHAFARLTIALENAAGVAAEGQSLRVGARRRLELVASLEASVDEAGRLLDDVKAAMKG